MRKLILCGAFTLLLCGGGVLAQHQFQYQANPDGSQTLVTINGIPVVGAASPAQGGCVGGSPQGGGCVGYAPQGAGCVGGSPQGGGCVGYAPQGAGCVGGAPQGAGCVGGTPQGGGCVGYAPQTVNVSQSYYYVAPAQAYYAQSGRYRQRDSVGINIGPLHIGLGRQRTYRGY